MEALIDETIEYDKQGRMKYHPDYHFAHQKHFTEEELLYLCFFYEKDDALTLSFALGKTTMTLADKKKNLVKAGTFGKYKRQWESQFEKESGETEMVDIEEVEVVEQPKSDRGKLLNVFGVTGEDGLTHQAGFVFSRGRKHADLLAVMDQEEKSKKARLSKYGQSLYDSCFRNW